MSDEINDGGPAFPRSGMESKNGTYVPPVEGMSLRDYFAIRSLEIANTYAKFTDDGICYETRKKQLRYEAAAEIAYKFADAMIKERENQNG